MLRGVLSWGGPASCSDRLELCEDGPCSVLQQVWACQALRAGSRSFVHASD